MVFSETGGFLLEIYQTSISFFPPVIQKFISFFLIALLIVLYAVFIWKFYKSVAKKNLIGLDLNKYNKAEHPVLIKLIAAGLYFIEYILILPFLIFLWFAFFTVFLIILTENIKTETLLILSGTTIAAIRMISYYSEDLSRDVAKLIPFTLMATSLLNPNFFSVERVLGHIQKIPFVFEDVLFYLIFIIFLEVILRIFELIFSFFQLNEKIELKKD